MNNEKFFTPQKMKQLEDIINTVSKDTFFPIPSNIIRFAKIPAENVKCVVLGMEPYASWFCDEDGNIVPEATGRSFEVASVSRWDQPFKQTSLRNILKSLYYLHTGKLESMDTIREKISSGDFPISQPHEWFDKMEEQGVVFLNASLTVKKDKPNTHTHHWESFMTSLIEYYNSINPDIIWILAGDKAQSRALNLVNKAVLCPHPRVYGFVKECPFECVKDVEWIR